MVMKKKKTFGLYGTDKRKTARNKEKYRADRYTEDMYEDFDYEYGGDEEYEEYDEDDEYIVAYRSEEDYEEDYEELYEDGEEEEYDEDSEYDDEYDEDSFDTAYGGIDNRYDDSFDGADADFAGRDGSFFVVLKEHITHMTAFDAVLLATGVTLFVAAAVILSMFFQSKRIDGQIAAIAPLGTELAGIGTVGGSGLSSITDAALSDSNNNEAETEIESTVENTVNASSGGRVNVSFVSVERDLKIRFTDADSGELITGTRFEVTLKNISTKKELVLTDDDMDGIIYAENVKAGTFDAVVASTDKYKFPELAQQVTVKDKVEYVVINVQDEVKSEKQVNVAAEDTQKQDAALEEVKLTDTVEWVESSKAAIGGSETYLPVDKNTIPDPSSISMAAARMLFDTINVELDKKSITMKTGEETALKGTSFSDKTEGNIEYKYAAEWKSSDEAVAVVKDGTVTAKSAGTAVITYTVTRKTITTTYELEKPTEETIRLEREDYEKLSEAERKKCTPITDDAGQIIAYEYKKVTEPEKKVSEVFDTAGASCEVKVEAAVEGNESEEKSEAGTEAAGRKTLAVTLDRTQGVYIAVGGTTTLTAAVSGYTADAGVTWETSDKKVAAVSEKGTVTGVSVGSATITAITKEKDGKGNPAKAACVVTVNANAQGDTVTKLKDANGNQIYLKNSDGSYKDAVFADYYTADEFYIKTAAQYKYTGWQTIDGKTYFYDKNGTPVKGTQIIQGVTYNFGADGAIAASVNGSKFGIDVSRHNGDINWNAVKASGVDYVIIRCGYRGSSTGVLIQDQNFKKNIQGAAAAGLKVGIYVFSQAVNEVEAVKEASLAVACASGYNLTYPIFIDTESSGGRADRIDKATRTAVVNAFCQTVVNSGYKAGIYASKTWFEDKLSMGLVGNYRIWLAQYTAAPTYKGKYDMWQYSSKGKISGINGNVDLNLSYMGY